MTTIQVTQIGKEMLELALYLAAPVIIAGMVIGLLVSVIQTITQIQEQSVSFVLKIVASGLSLLFFAPWMLRKILDFASSLLGNLTKFIR